MLDSKTNCHQVLDFGASRDGIAASERGSRKLLRFDDPRSNLANDAIEVEDLFDEEL